ncbi:MAG: hypothetical protein NZ455_05340 [Bacteroidia bacterium]|nr:hypothetical protein [Bacteroidia bacterium]MDW8346286.1 hypothetical protein [Bacteroidia bacterium]
MRRVREQCGAQRSTEAKRSPQHADLAHTSAASRGQGHAQKITILKILQNNTTFIVKQNSA